MIAIHLTLVQYFITGPGCPDDDYYFMLYDTLTRGCFMLNQRRTYGGPEYKHNLVNVSSPVPALKHITTLFSLFDHYILSREWGIIFDHYKPNIMAGL